RHGMEAARRTRTVLDPREPRADVRETGIARLADAAAEVERAVQDDVGDREAVARDPALAGEELVEPGELVAGDRLQTIGGLGQHAHALAEQLDALGVAEA